jgi:hypothetical protein
MTTNKFNYPSLFYEAFTHDEYDRGDADWSITQLIDAPQIRVLKEHYAEEIEAQRDVSENVAMVIGTVMHNYLEGFVQKPCIAEERFFMQLDGWTISGQVDLQELLGNDKTYDKLLWCLQDHKTCKAYAVIFGKIEWENQLNGYAALVEDQTDRQITKLQANAIILDWTRSAAMRDKNYPRSPIEFIDIPLWSRQERKDYLRARIALHELADFEWMTDGTLPECTDQERWTKPTTYAVMKGKNKRATKVCDTRKDAEKYIEIHSTKAAPMHVQKRPGESTRCKDNWCKVNQWCTQYQQEQEDAQKN